MSDQTTGAKDVSAAAASRGKGKNAVMWLWKVGWLLFPIIALGLGAGLGRTYFPEMHTRVFEWQALKEPLINTQWFSAIHNKPLFHPLPLGGGKGMGIIAALCALWGWSVYKRVNEDQIRAKTLKAITSECFWLAIVMTGIVIWKIALGTLSWWALPPFFAALVCYKLAHDTENKVLANRDTARGREGTK